MEFVYDPATKRISVQSISRYSVDFSDYPDGITTASELLCFLAALSKTVIGYFGDLVWLEKNYALMKLVVEVLDHRAFSWDRIRINASDYEDWDYINTSFDEEIEIKKSLKEAQKS